MKYLVFAVLFLIFLSRSIPIEVNAALNSESDLAQLAVRVLLIPVFKKCTNIGGFLSGAQKVKNGNTGDSEKGKNGKLLSFGLNIIKRLKVPLLTVYAKFGTGDAAVDGLSAGSIKIAFINVCEFFRVEHAEQEITPLYDSEGAFFDFSGIFSLSFADIIVAAMCTLFGSVAVKRRTYANVTE